jgi:anti-sigma factor RsiW
MSSIPCAELEILLADFLDGTLNAERKATVESHLSSCAACAELARDASGAIAFMERVAAVAPPPVMVNRILLEVTRGVIKPTWTERWLGRTVLQPRFAMGLAMAALSLAMLGRFGAAAENGMHRAWDRTLKNYESLALVYDVQTQLQEWGQDTGAGNK